MRRRTSHRRAPGTGVWLGLMLSTATCQRSPLPGPAARPSAALAPRNVFAPGGLAAGDTVLCLPVAAIEVLPSPVDSAGWIGEVRFTGPIALSGEYRRHPDPAEPSEPCFFPTAPRRCGCRGSPTTGAAPGSASSIPTLPGGGWEGRRRGARAVVDQYRYRYFHTEVHNTARLVQVLR
jgi:hypothetical protein